MAKHELVESIAVAVMAGLCCIGMTYALVWVYSICVAMP